MGERFLKEEMAPNLGRDVRWLGFAHKVQIIKKGGPLRPPPGLS